MTNPDGQGQALTIVHIFPTKIWIESDLFGGRHVVIQHQDGKSDPFTYASFHYNYRYTDNAGTRNAAESMARQLGATDPIEQRSRIPVFMDQKALSCWCEKCDKATNQGLRSRMSLCPTCGDKRCPRSIDHEAVCATHVKPAGDHGKQS